MGKITLARGLLASGGYLQSLEFSIKKSFKGVEMKPNLLLKDLEDYQEFFVQNIAGRLKELEYSQVEETLKEEAYFYAMLGDSRRIRPLLLFLGNLCGNKNVSKKSLILCGSAIEHIHKMSLILDDYFDNDSMRRGNPTFHTQYDKNVMIFMTDFLLKMSNSLFLSGISSLSIEEQRNFIALYSQIITDMGNGFLQDLDRKERKITMEEAFRINDLQSTTILRNSLLIGYSLSNGMVKIDRNYECFDKIGSSIGKTFQGFNDVENFLVQDIQLNNKGNLYTDLKQNRKNIVLGQVPEALFLPPYTDDDIINYIMDNYLIEQTVEQLTSNTEGIKENIHQLSNKVARETLLYMTDSVVEKTLRKVRNCKTNSLV